MDILKDYHLIQVEKEWLLALEWVMDKIYYLWMVQVNKY
jgi:hypothetical protein